MGDIRVLKENVACQIAAGEVIERPASIVRELIDNSIDAGADHIALKIERGGKRFIQVADNGKGMGRDDLLLSVERHATSKLRKGEDLFHIKTLGFRGEALPSIASVSRLELTSRKKEDLVGHRLVMAGGKLKSLDETGSPAGTTVVVRDLFYQMPARKKFLRTDRTESDHILKTVSRIALPFTGLHFILEAGGKTILLLPSTENMADRLSLLFGSQVASATVEAETIKDFIKVRAFLAPPDYTRTRADRILTYVNHRGVRDRFLTHAVMEGYGQRLMKGQYPQVVLLIEIDPTLVDVNVHPAKQEIRFRQGASVSRFISDTINNVFSRNYPSFSAVSTGTKPYRREELPLDGTVGEKRPSFGHSGGRRHGELEDVDYQIERQSPLLKSQVRYIGQLNDTYLLFQGENGLLIIDQHAAHERVVYETLKRGFEGDGIEQQRFLIPPSLEFGLQEARIIEKNLDQLGRMGLEMEYFGGNTFLLRSVPSILETVDWEAFLRELIPHLEKKEEIVKGKAFDQFIVLMACHNALRSGQSLSQQEINYLLKQLEGMSLPTHCPHGRPIFRTITYKEIEKMFGRVV